MSWNYPGAGPPPGYGGFAASGPPGLGPPPPGMHAAPGVGPAPGMMQAQQTPGPGGFPANFNPAAQMPNVDFSAPVIRLGTGGPPKPDTPGLAGRSSDRTDSGRPRGTGLGFERGRDGGGRQETIAIVQPTREEIARTIFIGNITKAMGTEDDLHQILNAAGGLRRWTRALDVDGVPCSFGFAEYEDADSLAIAADVLQDVKVPTKASQTNGSAHKTEDDADETVKEDEDAAAKPEDNETDRVKVEENEEIEQQPTFDKLLVVIDENSEKYVQDWRSRGALKDPAEQQFAKDSAIENLANILANLARVNLGEMNGIAKQDGDGDVKMETDAFTGEVVNITIPQGEDELSEIPPEMRETVAKEITAFRDRSIRRDMERLRREEELEAAEKRRSLEGSRINRLATPPPTNGNIPSGPRGVPQGPRVGQGVQIPSDYRNGVAFVSDSNNASSIFTAEEEDSELKDEQLEERRQRQRTEELEKMYLDQERRWLARERQRTAALEREKTRAAADAVKAQQQKEDAAERLRNWNDDDEAARKAEQYYIDRPLWARSRKAFRDQEAKQDEQDRAAEARENHRAQEQHRRDMGMADDFLAQAAEEFGDRFAPAGQPAARFKMSLGAAASQRQEAAAKGQRRTVAEVEGLLEDEEDAAGSSTRRTLVPLSAEQLAATASLTDEERQQAQKELAAAIPSDTDGLWAWNVPWEHVSETMVAKDLRPFVEKKIVEYLGVQEDMVVDVAIDAIRGRSKPQALVAELEGALDEEAEVMVKKLWRMLIFYSESEKRGLSAS